MKTTTRSEQVDKDLTFGKWGELTIIPFLQDLFKVGTKSISYWYSSEHIYKNKSDLKKWDLRFGVYDTTYFGGKDYIDKIEFEIKTDKYREDTGNLVFEKSCGGKKSGVFATEAKYFVYWMPLFKEDNFYIIKTEKLRDLLGEFNTHIISGGDKGSNTMMYRVSKAEFNDVFKSRGGKILTISDYTIPEEFQLERFEEKKYIYTSDELKKYDDEI
jgi:hypothetical protein